MKINHAFTGYSSNDVAKAKEFYGQTLGLELTERMGGIGFTLSGCDIFIYPKPNHEPASFTVLNFVVDDIDAAVDELVGKGVTFEKYEGFNQDEKGIARGLEVGKGPNIAWFKDPAGNILAVIQDK